MKLTRLWFFVPFLTLFLACYFLLEAIPFLSKAYGMCWWKFPTFISILIVSYMSIFVSILKGIEGER